MVSHSVFIIIIFTLAAIYYKYKAADNFNHESVRGKMVLITGSSSGIGEEMAYQYCKMGASVMMTARRADVLKNVATKCKALGATKAEYFAGDINNPKDREQLIIEISSKLGGLDCLILNHAIFYFDLWEYTSENMTALQKSIDINFLASVDIASRSLPLLAKSNGSIGVVSSIAGKIPIAFSTYYSPAKFALDGFFTGFRQELDFKGINVSVTLFVLGAIKTDSAIEVQQRLFPKFVHEHAAVNDTAFVIIKGVETRAYIVYHPIAEWYYDTLYCLLPRVSDYIRLSVITEANSWVSR